MSEIFRPLTKEEREDFVDISKRTLTEQQKIIRLNEPLISQHNRVLLKKSVDITKEKLFCYSCWSFEFKVDEKDALENFEDCVENYSRLVYDKFQLKTRQTEHMGQNISIIQDVHLDFICPYCHRKQSFGFSLNQLSPEVQKFISDTKAED